MSSSDESTEESEELKAALNQAKIEKRNNKLARVVRAQKKVIRKNVDGSITNTEKAYAPKRTEWQLYCKLVYPNDWARLSDQVTPERTFNFLFYVSYRKKKKRGRCKKTETPVEKFSKSEYEKIMEDYEASDGNILNSTDIISHSAINQYKAVIKEIFLEQATLDKRNSWSWEKIWDLRCQELFKVTKERKNAIDKANYVEKTKGNSFAFFRGENKTSEIEQYLFNVGRNTTSHRTSVPAIRNRFVFLWSKNGVLRCESIYSAELSDLQHVSHKAEKDAHNWVALIMEIAHGKSTRFCLCLLPS